MKHYSEGYWDHRTGARLAHNPGEKYHIEKDKFKLGDKVWCISKHCYEASKDNPWKWSYYACQGIVLRIETWGIVVRWDNGRGNTYGDSDDLELVRVPGKAKTRNN